MIENKKKIDRNNKERIIRLFIEGMTSIDIKANDSVISEINVDLEYININDDNIIEVKNFITTETKVKDVHRYDIHINNDNKIELFYYDEKNNDFADSKFYDLPTSKYDGEMPVILMILESPHKNEYKYEGDKIIPIAPAQGKTGINIEEHIEYIIREIKKYQKLDCGEYRFLICNPVPYQTSLDALFGKGIVSDLRNKVWKAIWDCEFCKEDFNKKIGKYKPKIIINACTKDLKEYINMYLQENKYENIFSTTHPASWRSYNVREVKHK